MSFLRRLFGGDGDHPEPAESASPNEIAEAERAHELEMAREDAERLDDLGRRQLRYADRAWTPEPQGGERRADDEDAGGDEG